MILGTGSWECLEEFAGAVPLLPARDTPTHTQHQPICLPLFFICFRSFKLIQFVWQHPGLISTIKTIHIFSSWFSQVILRLKQMTTKTNFLQTQEQLYQKWLGNCNSCLSPALKLNSWERSTCSSLMPRTALHLSVPSFTVNETILLQYHQRKHLDIFHLFLTNASNLNTVTFFSESHALMHTMRAVNHLPCTVFKTFHYLPA